MKIFILILMIFSQSIKANTKISRCFKYFASELSDSSLSLYLGNLSLNKDINYVLGTYKTRRNIKKTGFYLYEDSNIYFVDISKKIFRSKERLKKNVFVSLNSAIGSSNSWKYKFINKYNLSNLKMKLQNNKIFLSEVKKEEINEYRETKYKTYLSSLKKINAGRKIASVKKAVSFDQFVSNNVPLESVKIYKVVSTNKNYKYSIDILTKRINNKIESRLKDSIYKKKHIDFLRNELSLLENKIKPEFSIVRNYYSQKRLSIFKKIESYLNKLESYNTKIGKINRKNFEWDTFNTDESMLMYYKTKRNFIKSQLVYLEDNLDLLNFNERKIDFIYNNLDPEVSLFNIFNDKNSKPYKKKLKDFYKLKSNLKASHVWINFSKNLEDYFKTVLDFQRLNYSLKDKRYSYKLKDFRNEFSRTISSVSCKKSSRKLKYIKSLSKKIGK